MVTIKIYNELGNFEHEVEDITTKEIRNIIRTRERNRMLYIKTTTGDLIIGAQFLNKSLVVIEDKCA